jgi:hypothetical protein
MGYFIARINMLGDAHPALSTRTNELTCDGVNPLPNRSILVVECQSLETSLYGDRESNTSVRVERAGDAHPTGTTRLKMWAFRVLENAISIILSDRVTHIFSLVKPLLA